MHEAVAFLTWCLCMKLVVAEYLDGEARSRLHSEGQRRLHIPSTTWLQARLDSLGRFLPIERGRVQAKLLVDIEPAMLSSDQWWGTEEMILQRFFGAKHSYSARIIASEPLRPPYVCHCLDKGVVASVKLADVRSHVFELARAEGGARYGMALPQSIVHLIAGGQWKSLVFPVWLRHHILPGFPTRIWMENAHQERGSDCCLPAADFSRERFEELYARLLSWSPHIAAVDAPGLERVARWLQGVLANPILGEREDTHTCKVELFTLLVALHLKNQRDVGEVLRLSLQALSLPQAFKSLLEPLQAQRQITCPILNRGEFRLDMSINIVKARMSLNVEMVRALWIDSTSIKGRCILMSKIQELPLSEVVLVCSAANELSADCAAHNCGDDDEEHLLVQRAPSDHYVYHNSQQH